MKNNKKKSLRTMIFGSLAVFIVLIIALLWLFEVVLLDDMYKQIKKTEIKSISNEISDNIEERDLYRRIDKIAEEKGICIIVTDKKGMTVCSAEGFSPCIVHKLALAERRAFIEKAISEKGKSVIYYGLDEVFNPMQSIESVENRPVENRKEGILYTTVINTVSGTYGIMLNAQLTPVEATVNTLKLQLLIVSIILIVVATILSLVLVKVITNPISKINKSASALARSNYDVRFEEGSYKEIDELAGTLNFAASELSKTDSLQKELIANVSHDIRTPLTMIKGYAEAMRDIPGENNAENAQIVIDEASRLATLVNDMLDLSRLQSQTATLSLTKFNLTDCIREIIAGFGKFCENNDFTISLCADTDVWIEADKIKVSSVIYNLLSNAVNYSGDSKEVLVNQSVQKGFVRIEIVDKGKGIAPDELPFVWQRYYRSKDAHKRATVGTGLGLSIVKKILDLHKVNYGVISSLGNGSTFWFEFKTV